MKTIILSLIFSASLFAQGMYLSKESGFSLGFIYGANEDNSKLSFGATYSLLGMFDLSYKRSTIFDEKNTDNFQNDFSIRGYILKGKLPIFLSGSLGYIYQKAETKLWNNYPLTATAEGITYGAGLYLLSQKDQNSAKIVVSILFRFFNSIEEIRIPTGLSHDTKLLQSLIFEAAIVYYFSQIGIAIGPKFIINNNFKNLFYGLNLTLILKH